MGLNFFPPSNSESTDQEKKEKKGIESRMREIPLSKDALKNLLIRLQQEIDKLNTDLDEHLAARETNKNKQGLEQDPELKGLYQQQINNLTTRIEETQHNKHARLQAREQTKERLSELNQEEIRLSQELKEIDNPGSYEPPPPPLQLSSTR